MATKIIDNFTGRLTRESIGDLNSGYAKYATTFGSNPFFKIKNLTWLEAPVQISGAALTGLVMAARPNLDSAITNVYTISDDATLVKIQVNNGPTVPDYDTPLFLATLSSGTPTFQFGSSMQFYGASQQIFIGHDKGVTKIDFNGSNELAVGITDSSHWIANVPRPSAQFLGKLYFGNGNNIAEIDSTKTVTTYTKLSPSFPSGTYVRDIDVSPDGNYLQIVVSRIPATGMATAAQDSNSLASTDSYKFYWNGVDTGYTSYESYNGYALTSNTTFSQYNFTLGYDLGGTALYSDSQKVNSLPNFSAPNFGAMFSTGNMLGFLSREYVAANSDLEGALMLYGQYDNEVPAGLFRFFRAPATTGTDVLQNPVCLSVSNLFYGGKFSGATNNIIGTAKIYYSTLEVDNGGGLYRKFYKFVMVPTGLGTAIGGVYETQQETSFKLFRSIISKKFKISSVRLFTEPLVTNNSFKIDLIGSDGNPMAGGTQTFTVGTNVTAGDDMVQYSPAHRPTYSVGVRITNLGSVNWTGVKMELDYEEFGIK